MQCSQLAPVQGCLIRGSGAQESVLIHYEYRVNVDGDAVLHAVRVTNAVGAILTVNVGDTLSAGVCAVSVPTAPAKPISANGGNYASGSFAASYDPAGNGGLWTAPLDLQSFTVIVREAGNVPSAANIVVVHVAGGKYFMTQDQIRTWSVAQDVSGDEYLDGITMVEGVGDTAFEVIWTIGG